MRCKDEVDDDEEAHDEDDEGTFRRMFSEADREMGVLKGMIIGKFSIAVLFSLCGVG